jgi:hypothetical protein
VLDIITFLLWEFHGKIQFQINIFGPYQLFYPSNGATAQIEPWPPLLRFPNNNVLRCEVDSLTTNPRLLWGTNDFLLGFTPLAKGSSFKALKIRPPSHSHLLHNPFCFAPGPPRGGWESGFAGRACRLNTQEAFWYLTGHAYISTIRVWK